MFNSVESFNATSFYQAHRGPHGLVTDFIQMGGTGGVGNVWEPNRINNCNSEISFPVYAIGYPLIDAIYQGLPHIAFAQIVAGDPLTMIFDPTPITLPNNYVFENGDYREHYYVPEGNTVYIEDNANLNFIRNASIDVDGELIIGNNATINFTKYSSLRLKDAVIQPNSNLNFVDKSILIVKGNMQLEDNLIIDLFDESGMMMYNDGNVTFIGNSLINFNHSSSLYGDDVFLGSSSNYNFKDASYIESNDLTISSGASINFVHSGNCIVNNELKIEGATDVTFSNLTADNLILDAETEVSFNNFSTSVLLKKMFLINGTETSNVILNMSDNLNILFMGTVDFKMNYCNWNGGGIKVQPNTSGDLSNLEVSNSNFNNLSFPFYLDKSNATILNAHFNNNSFNFSIDNAIYSIGIDSLIIENTTFNSVQDISVFSYINNITFISNCDFSSVNKGIQVGIRYPRELSNYDKLVFILTGSTFVNTEIGVDAAMDDLDSIYISGNNLDVNDIGISVVEFLTENVDLTIINNEIRNANTAISLIEGSEAVITKNTLVDNTIGVYVSQVSNPFVINNAISAENISTPGSGIVLLSSDGVIRKNSISGHSNGIELGNSSPDIGDNTITDNLYHGIYIGSGSLPNMVGTLAGSPPLQYPTAGYNDIYENGGWDDPNAPPDNDGSEIFISFANALMERGCNSIVDDRAPGGTLVNTQYLMGGESFGMPIQVYAEYNFWSVNPLYQLEDRFNNLIVYYDPIYNEPCDLPQGASGGGNELFVTTSNGAIIDTLYSIDIEIGELSTTELLYAVAEEKFLTADYENAEGVYNQIINSNDTLFAKLKAYQRLYNLGRLTHKSPDYFSDLKTVYSSLSQSATDSLLQKIFSQLASLSLVGQTEYVSAIAEFDAVVQQNQGTEEAMYAEIDALTTALLLTPDSSLGKGRLGKYAVTDISDYTNRVSNLLKQRVGSSNYNKVPIPTEYALYQNYPNPFNPSTTIKYSIIKTGKVKLAVYDILGREVIVLADEVKEPGFYEVNFNASYLSSGVYFYRLISGSFVSTRKMLLVK